MHDTDEPDIAGLAEALTRAWDAGDGTAFARCFTDDADFVNIFAMHFVGRDAIAKQHQLIFDGVYKGSRNAFTVASSRKLGDAAVLALLKAELRVTEGPAAGQIDTLATAVLIRDPAGWRITSFHNTRKLPPPL